MKEVVVPAEVAAAMAEGAVLIFSLSGGKDSSAMLRAVMKVYKARRWTGQVIVLHADLGRIEWKQSIEQVRKEAAMYGVPLEVVRHTSTNGEMVDRWKQRMVKTEGTGTPFWSSSEARYCTSDMKRDTSNVVMRRFRLVIHCEGLRAEESPARAKKPVLKVRDKVSASALVKLTPAVGLAQRTDAQRLVIDWRPIHAWTLEDVLNECGTSVADLERRRALYREGRVEEALDGWPIHPAYVFGNERVSCMFCVFGSVNDLRNAAQHNPTVLAELIAMERQSGFTFKSGWSLTELLDS